MLIKLPPKMTARRVTLRLSDGMWLRLDDLQRRAEIMGKNLDIEAALTSYLSRQIVSTERELKDISGE